MKLKLISIVGLALLTGCSSYTPRASVFPMENDRYKLIATSRTEHGALKVAQIDAEGICKDNTKSKKYAVIDQKTTYVGADKNAESGKGFGGAAMKLAQTYSSMQDRENFKVEMVFKCAVASR